MHSENSREICFVTTLAANLEYFYRDLIVPLHRLGFRFVGVSSVGPGHEVIARLGGDVHAVEIKREPSPLRDLLTLARLCLHFRRRSYRRIVISTPKASLLAGLACFFAGKSERVIYVVRGRVYEDYRGMRRLFYQVIERLTCALSKKVLLISPSLKESFLEENICAESKLSMFANGSSKGVNVSRFDPDQSLSKRLSFRNRHGINVDACVIGFAGWLRREKGIDELVEAFVRLTSRFHDLELLLVGEFEHERDRLSPDTLAAIEKTPTIHVTGWVSDPVDAYSAMDIFVIPSYREGFGNVAIEAAAMGLPVVATDVPGLRDAVVFGETAVRALPRDATSLESAIALMVTDRDLRLKYGATGRRRICAEFDQVTVLNGFLTAILGTRPDV